MIEWLLHSVWRGEKQRHARGGWVIEGQARMTQDKICIGGDRPSALCFDDIAGGFAGYVPEINGLPLTQGKRTHRRLDGRARCVAEHVRQFLLDLTDARVKEGRPDGPAL